MILMRKAKKIRKETGRDVYAKAELDKTSILENVKLSFLRPTKMLVTEFVVISFTLWVSFGKPLSGYCQRHHSLYIAWGLLFLFQSSVPQTFGAK